MVSIQVSRPVQFGRFTDVQQEKLSQMDLETYQARKSVTDFLQGQGKPPQNLQKTLQALKPGLQISSTPSYLSNLSVLDEWQGEKDESYKAKEKAFVTDLKNTFGLMEKQYKDSGIEPPQMKATLKTFAEVLFDIIDHAKNYTPSEEAFAGLMSLLPPALKMVVSNKNKS